MICCQFIFKPGTYDDDFHELDGQIDTFARSLPGLEKGAVSATSVVSTPSRGNGPDRMAGSRVRSPER